MSRLDQLIADLCPDGVKYYSLIEIFNLRNGYTPSRNQGAYWVGGTIPWFRMEDLRANGFILSDSIGHITPSSVKGTLFEADSIIMATSATIGDHALIKVPYLSNQRFTNLTSKPQFSKALNPMFIFYYCFLLGDWARKNVNMSGFASVDMERFKEFKFPVPPLPVQEEIVRILDTFSALEAELEKELEKELEARTKQYEHYRDDLLNFDPKSLQSHSLHPTRLNHLIQTLCPNGVEITELRKVCEIRRGVRVVRNQLKEIGDYPVFQNSLTPMGYHDKWNCLANSAFVISAGAAGEIGYSTVDFWAADDCFFFDCPGDLSNRFLYYFLLCQKEYLSSRVRRASVPRLSRLVIEQLEIPVPPLPVQEEIVAILDRFEALVSDLKSGLPAEIALRRKQYEYYRDKLLTFQPLP